MNPEAISISENVSLGIFPSGSTLSQSGVGPISGKTYRLTSSVTVSAGILIIREDSKQVGIISVSGTSIIDFVSIGGGSISFTPSGSFSGSINDVRLRQLETAAVTENQSIKEFLTGETDEGSAIVFRVDTQTLQLQTNPEMYSNPTAVLTETERGSMVKAFVSLDDKQFYELEGTVVKGVSILKINTPSTDDNGDLPLTQSIQISYRDSSKQLCRLIQTAISVIPTTIDSPQ